MHLLRLRSAGAQTGNEHEGKFFFCVGLGEEGVVRRVMVLVYAFKYCRNIAGQIINQGDVFFSFSSVPLDEHCSCSCSCRSRGKLSNCVLAVLQVVLVDVSRQLRAEELALAPS